MPDSMEPKHLSTERDPELNLTVLSGEIGTGAINDNTYHVVYFNNVGNQTLIDGFNITAGYIFRIFRWRRHVLQCLKSLPLSIVIFTATRPMTVAQFT
jgi:hypothetical protein